MLLIEEDDIMVRGDIYYVRIGREGVGSEQKGNRYCVIIQEISIALQ